MCFVCVLYCRSDILLNLIEVQIADGYLFLYMPYFKIFEFAPNLVAFNLSPFNSLKVNFINVLKIIKIKWGHLVREINKQTNKQKSFLNNWKKNIYVKTYSSYLLDSSLNKFGLMLLNCLSKFCTRVIMAWFQCSLDTRFMFG